MELIKINKKEYPVKFGLSVIRRFAAAHKIKTLNDFERWFTKLDQNSFETIDQLIELILLGFKRGCKSINQECDLTSDDILDLTMEDPKEYEKLLNALSTSIAGDVDLDELGEGKAQAVKKK